VPEAQRAAVFGDFVQLQRTGTPEGTGLGLAIAAHMVERMGGRIGCTGNDEAPDGRGAVFWVEIPLRPLPGAADGETPGEDEAPTAGPAGTGRRPPLRVLVADDVPANQAVARALLEPEGHGVDCVSDGRQALEAVARAFAAPDGPRPYDAVLMDVMMPEMDGLEASRRIRALEGPAARVPIIAVTARAFPEDIAACRAACMDDHIVKPIDRGALLQGLARLARGRDDAAPPPPPGRPRAAPSPPCRS
jgi:CheY-like chemotaxis protein